MKTIAVVGPTASGKTAFAIELYKHLNIPIVNCDSRQFWPLKILTASPTDEELQMAPHLLFNYLNGNIKPSLGIWMQEIKKIPRKIIVGGNGFYINCLRKGIPMYEQIDGEHTWQELYELNPNTDVHPNDKYRINRQVAFLKHTGARYEEYNNKYIEDLYIIAIIPNKEVLLNRIIKRTKQILPEAINEIKNTQHFENYNSIIGYKECLKYLNGNISYEELEEEIILRTFQYAKKQIKFLKSMPINVIIEQPVITEKILQHLQT